MPKAAYRCLIVAEAILAHSENVERRRTDTVGGRRVAAQIRQSLLLAAEVEQRLAGYTVHFGRELLHGIVFQKLPAERQGSGKSALNKIDLRQIVLRNVIQLGVARRLLESVRAAA